MATANRLQAIKLKLAEVIQRTAVQLATPGSVMGAKAATLADRNFQPAGVLFERGGRYCGLTIHGKVIWWPETGEGEGE
jgi:hypothetical protein